MTHTPPGGLPNQTGLCGLNTGLPRPYLGLSVRGIHWAGVDGYLGIVHFVQGSLHLLLEDHSLDYAGTKDTSPLRPATNERQGEPR